MIYGTWYYAHSFSTDYRNDKTHFEGTRSRYTDTYTHVCTYMHAKRGRTHTRQEKHTTLVRVSSGTQTSTRFIPLRSVLRVSVVSHEISFFFFFFSFVVARVFHDIEILACCCWLAINRQINVCQEAVCEVRGTSFASTYVGVLIFQSVVEYFKTRRKE